VSPPTSAESANLADSVRRRNPFGTKALRRRLPRVRQPATPHDSAAN